MEHKNKNAGKISTNNVLIFEESLLPCSKAPSAEHNRSHDEDEPCDDSRAGKIDKK
ncbi:hypothetical protein PITCH_A1640050 [uncultured Desulfobacterium sp.]|uniref:Uncharacterized protein n=1 Tax=uncultured Desulfobacterium sp. TaxID=201089 RepID=A0A445MU84_9BACT|nr:hypothetical protein PITCH_A1640050 [uncultured Desulfobacterium sp.]